MGLPSLKEMLIARGHDATDADEMIAEMKERVANGDDPEEVLHDEGFEPDWFMDIV